MTNHVETGTIIQNADNLPAYSLGSNEQLLLTETGIIASTGLSSSAIIGSDNANIRIHGEVYAALDVAIKITGGVNGSTIDIASTGIVESSFGAIYSDVGHLTILNNGVLRGGNAGIFDSNGDVTVINNGQIYSHGLGNPAISLGSTGSGFNNDVLNHGYIYGYYQGGDETDNVTNTGDWEGGIQLGGGRDFFDSRLGRMLDGGASGGDGDDFLYGSEGGEFLGGDAGSDSITGMAGNDSIYGGTENDTVYAGLGNDFMMGGAGNDLLVGGSGEDDFYGDVGIDAASYQDASAAVIVNFLDPTTNAGDAAGDTYDKIENLIGSKYADRLQGDNFANRIIGAQGADTMYGNGGNDIYIVEHIVDRIVEKTNGGTDLVMANVSQTLSANVENLTLTGAGAINGVGNQLDNVISGNAAANLLSGAAGVDTLAGAGGRDTLTGGAGSDSFFFDTKADTKSNWDRITDFSVADDSILLENAVYTGLPTPGTLSAAAFNTGAAATDASDRIIYNSASGALLYDRDGTGAADAVKFAQLATGLALTNLDFIVV